MSTIGGSRKMSDGAGEHRMIAAIGAIGPNKAIIGGRSQNQLAKGHNPGAKCQNLGAESQYWVAKGQNPGAEG